MHVYHITPTAVYTTSPLGRTLAIAHVYSVVLGMSVPIAIGLGAYWLAGRWIAASYDHGKDRPTPYQLGVLMSTLNGANLSALWNSSNYMMARGSVPGGKALERPPMLRHAVFMLFFFLAVSYASAGVETWLGAASEAVLYPVTTTIQYDGVPLPAFGRRVNQTMCDETKDLSNNKPYQCGLVRGTSGNPPAQSNRILAMNGLSNENVIALTNDSTAIMVPPSTGLSDNLGYTATTLGVKSSCTSVTAQCVDMENLGANAGLATNCTSAVNFNTTSSGCNSYGATQFGGPLDPSGNLLACGVNSNSTDFRFGIVVRSYAYNVNNTEETFVGDTGFFLHGNKGGYSVLTCNIKSLNVTYHYFNGSYTLISSAPADLAQAQRISDGSWAGPLYVPDAVEGAGIFSGNYADAFAAKLSSVALSATAYVIEPTNALSTPNLISGPGYPWRHFCSCCSQLCSNAVVTVLAVLEIRKSPLFTTLAHSRLVNPATVIGAAYGPDESKAKPTQAIQELFGEETAADRLSVAESNDGRGIKGIIGEVGVRIFAR
ncbi:hypothetical protein B0H13DRAFT_2273026 [Mycena leptocephala]|nr:hypothetical protein B0H13DRAFT_2273026 [Mycena leptocephala]